MMLAKSMEVDEIVEAFQETEGFQLALMGCDIARLFKRDFPTIKVIEDYICGKIKWKEFTRKVDNFVSNNYDWQNFVKESIQFLALALTLSPVPKIRIAYAIRNVVDNVEELSTANDILRQSRPPNVEIPITPTLQSIARHIVQTRNFEEYSVLLDNLEEVHNIRLPRELPLGLSHYVLFTLNFSA